MKNNNKDNSLLPLCRQDTKKGKEMQVKVWRRLLIILHLLIIVGLLLIIVIVVRNTSRANAKGSQLIRSQ
jgi:uncharacterized membrane protein YqjE